MSNTVWTLAWSYRGLDRVSWVGTYLAFLLEETARKILPEAVLTCCVSGNIHMGCGYYKWGSCNIIRYSDIDAASVCIGSHSAG